jgi:hypothetical protein
MLNFLFAHPEFPFAPLEMAELCAAFDRALSDLDENGASKINWKADAVRELVAADIVAGRIAGEHDGRLLSEHAIQQARAKFDVPNTA